MGKGDVLVDHVPLEIRLLVAPFLEATRITDLRMRCARFLPGDEVCQGDLSIHPFALHVVEKTRLVMTLRARYFSMARSLPGFDIAIHLMAGTTESGGLREFQEPRNDNYEKDGAEKQEDLDPFFVGPSASFGLRKEIDPKGFHHLVKISHRAHGIACPFTVRTVGSVLTTFIYKFKGIHFMGEVLSGLFG